jgi:hypothetical protein
VDRKIRDFQISIRFLEDFELEKNLPLNLLLLMVIVPMFMLVRRPITTCTYAKSQENYRDEKKPTHSEKH